MLDNIDLHNGKEIKCYTFPVFHDWSADDVWLLLKPNIFEDENGKLQMHKLDREPDGEPRGWTNVVIKDGREYLPIEDCNCPTIPEIGMCEHWREIIVVKHIVPPLD